MDFMNGISDPSQISSQFLNEYSSKAVRNFLRPKSSIDKAYMITLVLWVGASIFISHEPIFRAYSFFGVILFLIVVNLETLKEGGEISLGGSAFKLFLMYLIIGFFVPIKPIDDLNPTKEPFPDLFISYYTLEGLVLLSFIILAVILGSINLTIIKKYKLPGYLASISKLARGLWVSGLVLFVFIGLGMMSVKIGDDFIILWEEYILAVLTIFISTSILPYTISSLSNSVVRRSPIAGFRDNALFSSVTLSLTDFIFNYTSKTHLTLDIWKTIIPFLFLAGIVIFIFERGDTQKSLNEKIIGKAMNRAEEFSQKINNLEFKAPEEVFVTDSPLDILKKHSTKVTTGKNSIIVPVSETADSVAVKIVGKTDVEVKDAMGKIKDQVTENTMLVLSKEEWKNITKKAKSKSLDQVDLSKISSKIGSKEELIQNAEDSLAVYKEWTNEKGLATVKNKLNSIMQGTSGYGVESSGAITKVNLPGIKVIDEPGLDIVKVGPIEVMDTKMGTNVKIGEFLKVVEIDKYTLVQMPFLSVLDTPKGNIVKLMGFEFSEGNKQEILGSLGHMLKLQRNLTDYAETRLSNMFTLDEEPSFVLTEGEDSTKLGTPKLLMASSEDSLFFDENDEISSENDEISSENDEVLSKNKKQDKKNVKKLIGKTFSYDIQIGSHSRNNREDKQSEDDVIELSDSDIEVIVDCPICNKELEGRTILCPHCGQEYHVNCFKKSVAETGKCPSCNKGVNIK